MDVHVMCLVLYDQDIKSTIFKQDYIYLKKIISFSFAHHKQTRHGPAEFVN
jgi:hypothetical protein